MQLSFTGLALALTQAPYAGLWFMIPTLVLSAGVVAHFARDASRVRPGMSTDEVAGLLGRPALVARSPGRATWVYRPRDQRLVVSFHQGRVLEVRRR